jgi:hypothetical protein
MMHHDHTVVTLLSLAEGGPAREYRHTRDGDLSRCEVILPFDSEWALGYKFIDGTRRRLELRIDDALVTESLILSGEGTLDRFVASDRRFRFVRADHADVADPTAATNGEVVVRLWRELPKVAPATFRTEDAWNAKGVLRGMRPQGLFGGGNNLVLGAATLSASQPKAPLGEAGATVEGSRSDQTFGSTRWGGDAGAPLEFRFRITGRAAAEAKAAPTGTAGFCPACGKRPKGGDRFCRTCGASLT